MLHLSINRHVVFNKWILINCCFWLTIIFVSCRNNNQSGETPAPTPSADSGIDRTVLPIQGRVIRVDTVLDARNAKAPKRFEVKAPPHAPNVIVVLIDDIGFGQCSAFGGPIHMPAAEQL